MRRIAWLIAIISISAVTAVSAQDDRSYWGVTGSIVPTWTVPADVKILYDADAVNISGGEFSIGVARGKLFGGDWGVTFIRKSVKDDSFIARGVGTTCVTTTSCFPVGSTFQMGNVVLTGIEAHKYVNFATIKRVAQVGLIVGGGIASAKGAIAATINDVEWNGVTNVPVQRIESTEYRDLFLDGATKVLPLMKLELAAGAILAPGVKVRFSGGLNLPGYHKASFSVVYLFGGH